MSATGSNVSVPRARRKQISVAGASSRTPTLMNMNDAPQSAASASGISEWRRLAGEGESWLKSPKPPFWRLKKPPFDTAESRRTERDHAAPGIQPKSVFQLGGAGHVGTASLRGLPYLLRLQDSFAIWPFDTPRLPLIVEIYPRIFTAGGWASGLPEGLNEHARDAAASALAMSRWDGDWRDLRRDERYLLEGQIWSP